MSTPPAPSAQEREDRIRVMLGIGVALVVLGALSCCCLGSALVIGTEGRGQTRPHHGTH